ncbi:hypothetical protein WJX77_011804 [Trebouxia sp. C0004]
MQTDLFDRSFKAAAAKYRRMHGLEQQQTEAEDSQALEGWAAEEHQTQERNTTPTPHQASTADSPNQRVVYSKDDLTDIAELSTASAADTEVTLKLRELHLERFSKPAGRLDDQQNGHRQSHPLAVATASSSTSHGNAADLSTVHTQQQRLSQQPKELASEPISHVEHQVPEDQQYSEADWVAYWQYYGYTAPPPPPPPGPPLCPTHLKLLEQMLSTTAEQSEPAPVTAQQAPPPRSQSPRDALQSRSQCIQDGKLTDLLMAWFDAGYQMGKHEAQTQNR